jgi:plasmid stability protein
MRQLTIRGFDDQLSRCIRGLAAREGISLNQAVLRLLRRGAGLGSESTGAHVVGSSLDHLMGTWTREEADEMERALDDLSRIDEAMWR